MDPGLATLYEILGVMPKANSDEVRIAYRRLARAFHPDVNSDPKAHERMAQINVAFEVLSDPIRRMEYDVTIGQHGYAEPTQSHDSSRPDAVQVSIAHRLRDHRTPVYSVGFASGGQMVSSSFDNEILWWSDDLSHPVRRIKLEGGAVSSLKVSAKGKVVAAGSTEQSVACWTIDGEQVDVWRSTPKDWVCCVAPSPDGESLAQGGIDHSVRVVRASDGQTRFAGTTHTESVTALAWSADSSYLATGSGDATVKLWCGTTGRELHTFLNVRSLVTSLAFSPDHRWLAVAAVDLSIRVFRLRDFVLKKTFFGHQKPIEGLAFHPRSWLLGSASRDGSVGLWNVKHGIGHGRIEASHHPISCIGFHPNGRQMVAGGLDKVLRVWDLSMPRS